jgi:hypothetical protein
MRGEEEASQEDVSGDAVRSMMSTTQDYKDVCHALDSPMIFVHCLCFITPAERLPTEPRTTCANDDLRDNPYSGDESECLQTIDRISVERVK